MATLTYMPTQHVPVLANELIALLDPRGGEVAVDCTFGGGGHAELVAQRLGSEGTLICMDRDPAAAERFEAFALEAPCETLLIRADYADALDSLRAAGRRVDLLYLDLGLSALEVVNEWPERRLAEIIRRFGEERHSGRIAREVVRRRPLSTTSELAEAIRASLPPAARFGRGHPAKRTFQAIRIAVNSELESLDRALPGGWELLRDGGRFAAISFHSLEDRRVKRFLADRARGCVCPPELPFCACGRPPEAELLTRRAVAPSPEEVERNPRSGSAHLRAALKLRTERGEG